ncbi:MAG: NAD(P)/FAD-dependent oxidoreductase [Myxococcota bacterium]|nr:NAD(P)/FAD-dependent oxidoreductase [Myxococcota bacterium]
MDASEPRRRRVLIVGGGFGGLKAAKSLRGVDVDVTIVDRENHHLFQPLLYQVATASLSPGSIAVPIRGVLGREPNVSVVLGEIVGADLERRRAKLRDGTELEYDWMIVACGARTSYFGHDEWAAHAHGLKDLRDAIRIRERVLLAFEEAERATDEATRRRLLTFVVVGGGPTGVEMAGAISELGRQVLVGDYKRIAPSDVRVLLVERADRVLTPFDRDLSYSAADQLRELGVELRFGTSVASVREGAIELVHDGVTETIAAEVVVWGAGVEPVPLAKALGVALDRRGRIRVDGSCAALGQAEVFAIGDVAAFVPEGETEALPGVAPVAMQQGRFVAEQIARDLRRLPRKTFRYVDKGIMATIGRSRAVVQGGVKLTGLLAWLAWCFIHVLYLIGFRNRFIVMFNWFWSYVTFKRGARLITARYDRAPDALPPPLAPRSSLPPPAPAASPSTSTNS